ncbi:MAG TPA: YraN family protein [Puia sp.]|nr:YraN family protein [Puia sp.]
MARHNDFGKWGEEIAAGWLAGKGFIILHRNWRHGRSEIDIIATRQGVYHFIEIKCSQGKGYGHPEERVSKPKLRNIMRAASHWLYLHHIPATTRIQFDVLAISFKTGTPEYFLIEDISL